MPGWITRHRWLLDLHNSSPNFTKLVAKLVKNENEERFLEKNNMDQYWSISNKVTVGHKAKTEDEFLPQKLDSERSLNPMTDISEDKKTNRKPYSTFPTLDKPGISLHGRFRCEKRGRRHRIRRSHRSPTPPAQHQNYSWFALEVLLSVIEKYQTAVDFPFSPRLQIAKTGWRHRVRDLKDA